MQFVTVRDLRLNPGDVWKSLGKEGELVLTSRGSPIALLTTVNARNLEEMLILLRRSKAQLAVTRMRQEALEKGVSDLSLNEIKAEIQAVRKKRHKFNQ